MLPGAKTFLRQRLGASLALLSALALVAAGVLVTLYEEQLYRAQKFEEIGVQARILGASVAAALVFNDDKAAQEYVNALQANPELEAAAVYDEKGNRVAGFERKDTDPPPDRAQTDTSYVASNRIYVVLTVDQGGVRAGTVYLRANMDPFARRLVRYGGIILLVTMGVLVVAVSGNAQKALTRANTRLESQAHQLSASNQKLQTEMLEREKAEDALRQAQKMEAIGQLSGGIAHDFNNLLSIIKGNLQLLQRRLTQGRTDVQRYLDSANEGVNRAANLTQRILAFSRRQPLSPKPVYLSQLVADMSDLLRHSVGDTVRIEMQLDADWPVLCDANQMENVIINLAINARDAMPSGGILTIETANRPPMHRPGLASGAYVELTVRDTGTGMSEEIRQKAVEPFFTTKPPGRGTGLGLSMTFGYVRQSNGDMVIESEIGKGTAITLLMPRYVSETIAVNG
ncbi:MAG TPA: CHASE sensor domain-containing protein [Micropepsaceae bacterium]|jgi:signal transduction histidine kinase|nr:CHASE sensor domain-containing protein [Micropepsaceae bacterium]